MGFRDPDISAIAKIFADPARATIVLALLDGERHQAGDLAACARIASSTASSHLQRLLSAGIVSVRREGARRTYAIADERARRAVEALASIAPDAVPVNPSLTRSLRIRRLAYARKCYDHLGGALAMRLVSGLAEIDAIQNVDGGFLLNASAHEALNRLGIGATKILGGSPFVRGCEDWTERGVHFGGPLGAAVYRALLDRNAIRANSRHRRIEAAPEAEAIISMAIKVPA
jgi:DNA-binding transcriptional ArsR family regulator